MDRLLKVNYMEAKELYSLEIEKEIRKKVSEIMIDYEMNFLIQQTLLMKIISEFNLYTENCVFCGMDNLDDYDSHLILRVFREQYRICGNCYNNIKKLPMD